MESDRWERLSRIVDALAATPPARRDALLEALCAADTDLRAEALELVAELEADPGFMARAPGGLQLDRDGPTDPLVGSRIGPWRVLRPVAAGGMGAVYVAERCDGPLRQQAALKLAYGGSDPEMQRRFRREQHILALLEHPHICRLIDGGFTDDGRLYIAMPYLDGALSLSRYAQEHALPLAERLALLRTVCAAVQYAHQNLVVHGDLKPGNVLVTPDGMVQLVDFGVARLLDPMRSDGHATMTAAARPFTAEYASPEQLAGGAPTTLSDVYALGVMLYELCCGERPFAFPAGDTAQALRIVAEREPPRPSLHCVERWVEPPGRLRRLLNGDLDRIAQVAMSKEPQRRYASAAALADDLDRHLRGLPVRAQAPTLAYQFGKLVRRHRWASIFATGAMISLLAFAVTLFVLYTRTSAQANQLRVERDRAEATADFLAGLFEQAAPGVPGGAASTAGELLDRGYARLSDTHSELPEAERAAALAAVGSAYRQLGRYDDSEKAMRLALDLYEFESVATQAHAQTLLEFANLQYRRQNYAQAEHFARRGLDAIDRAMGADAAERASYLNTLALALRRQARVDEAIGILQGVVELRRRSQDAERNTDLAANLQNLADLLHAQQRYDEAEPLFAEALAIFERSHGEAHVSVAYLLNSYGNLRLARGDLQAAEGMLMRAHDIARVQLGEKHPFVGFVLHSMARLHRSRGDRRAALDTGERAIGVLRSAFPSGSVVLANALVETAGDYARIDDAQGVTRTLAEVDAMLDGLPAQDRDRLRRRTESIVAMLE